MADGRLRAKASTTKPGRRGTQLLQRNDDSGDPGFVRTCQLAGTFGAFPKLGTPIPRRPSRSSCPTAGSSIRLSPFRKSSGGIFPLQRCNRVNAAQADPETRKISPRPFPSRITSTAGFHGSRCVCRISLMETGNGLPVCVELDVAWCPGFPSPTWPAARSGTGPARLTPCLLVQLRTGRAPTKRLAVVVPRCPRSGVRPGETGGNGKSVNKRAGLLSFLLRCTTRGAVRLFPPLVPGPDIAAVCKVFCGWE